MREVRHNDFGAIMQADVVVFGLCPRTRNIRGNLSFSVAWKPPFRAFRARIHSSTRVECARILSWPTVGNFKINYKRVTNFDAGDSGTKLSFVEIFARRCNELPLIPKLALN